MFALALQLPCNGDWIALTFPFYILSESPIVMYHFEESHKNVLDDCDEFTRAINGLDRPKRCIKPLYLSTL